MAQRERFTVSRSGPGTHWRIFDDGYSPQGWAFVRRESAERQAVLLNKYPLMAHKLMADLIQFREHGHFGRSEKVTP